jgi:hypothetical protein
VILSEQQQIDCSSSNFGCSGGWPFRAMQDLLGKFAGGSNSEESYPYQGDQQTCNWQESKVEAIISDYVIHCKETTNPCEEDQMALILYSKGPISVCMDASPLQTYGRGILDPSNCDSTFIDHCVVIVGYGQEHGIKYWLIKVILNGIEGDLVRILGEANGEKMDTFD